jgi:hypothetical protein
MGTTTYLERAIKDEGSREERVVDVEMGTSGYAGEGPQLYLNVGAESVLMSHDDAEAFVKAAVSIAHYFGYKLE